MLKLLTLEIQCNQICVYLTCKKKRNNVGFYLSGFLISENKEVAQCDLSIALFNKVFTRDFITHVFQEADQYESYELPLVCKNKKECNNKQKECRPTNFSSKT